METQARTVGGRSMNAIERGALRRRLVSKTSTGPHLASAEPAGGQVLPASVATSDDEPQQSHLKLLSSDRSTSGAAQPGRLHLTGQGHVEAELVALRQAIASLKGELADDRERVRGALSEVTAVRSQSLKSFEEIDRLQAALEDLAERVRAEQERARDRDESRRIGRPGVENDLQDPVRVLDHLAEEQAGLADAVSALSRELVAQRLRTTAIIFVAVAAAMVLLAIWLFFGGPSLSPR